MDIRRSEIELTDLLDLKKLQSIQDSLANLSGLSIVIFDPEGNRVTEQSSPYVRFCEEIIRSTPAGRRACRDCDKAAMDRALRAVREGKVPEANQCHAGLWDYVAPILIGDELFGYLWCGRVRAEEDGELDLNEHKKRAREYGINPEKYIAALREAPVLPKKRIEASADVVYQVAMAIAGQAYNRMTEQRRADRASSDLTERSRELTILQKTASLVVKAGDPREVLRQVLEEAQKTIKADHLCLYRYDRKYDRFDDPIDVGELYYGAARRTISKLSAVRQILAAGRPHFAESAQEDKVIAGPFAKDQGIASCAAFRLLVQRRRVGVLFINFRIAQKFSDARRQALAALANQVALAIDYHRAVEELRSKADQLARLHRSVTGVLRGSSLPKVFRRTVSSVSAAFGFDGVALYLVEEKNSRIRARYAEGRAKEWIEESGHPLDEEDILPDIWRKGKTEVIAGFDPRFDVDAFKRHHHENWVRVFMPVSLPDRIVGVLEAGYLLDNKPGIEDEEIRVLESFVHQAEIAIRNSRWLSENRALLKIAEVLARERDTGKILRAIVSAIRRVIPCSNCSVDLLEKRTGVIRTVASQGDEVEQVLNFELKPGEGVTGQVFETGIPEIVDKSDRRAVYVPGTDERDDYLLVVPIRSGDRVLGVIDLNRYGEVPFTKHDLEWVTMVADQVGVALERTELLERYQRLGDSAKAIVQRLPLKEVLNEIAAQAAETLDAPVVNVMLVAEDGKLVIEASVGLPSDFKLPKPLRIGEGLSGWVAAHREPYQTLDMAQDPKTANPDYLRQLGHVSYLGVPMIHRDELAGVLNVHTKHQREFTPDEVEVFSAFADLAAVAVSNARAFDQAVREFETLAGAGAAVSSPLGLEEVLDHLLRQGCKLVGADRGCVRIVNESGTLIVPRYWWPRRRRGELERPYLKKGQGISGYVWETGKPYRSPNVSKDPYYYKVYDDVASELAVPIVAQDQVIGVLNASSPQKNAFQERHERLLVELANLSSVAVEKSKLLTALREVAEATVTEPADFLRLLIDKVCGLVRVVCVPSIWLLDEPNQRIYYAAGQDDDPFAGCEPLPLDRSISGKVVTTRKPMVVEDIFEKELYYCKDIARKARIRSLLSVPIMAGKKAIGVFNVHTSKRHRFQGWEIDVLRAFASQAGAAIEINRSLTRLRLLQRYAGSLGSARNLAEVAEHIVEHTREAVDADGTGLWLYDGLTRRFHYGSSTGQLELREKEEIERALPRPEGMSVKILRTREQIVIADTMKVPPGTVHPDAISRGIRAIAGFPLLVGERPMGVLYVDFLHPFYYTSDQIETLEAMARLAAVAIDSARSVEAMKQFLITVTHDLKAPLSAIDAQIQVLGKFGYDSEVVRKIHGETRRLTQLVENLLGLLRAERAAKPLEPEQADLQEMLSDVEDMWSALKQERGLNVEVTVAPEARVVLSDVERVRCIVFNLLDNAMKFAKKDGCVRVAATRDETSFAIIVEDNGAGMSSDKVERLRLTTGQIPGPYWEEMRSGVGYAAVRRFTADMGGEVDIQSSHLGTRVIVRLPFLQPNNRSVQHTPGS